MSSVRIVSYSEVDTYRQCPHKHELAYKQRWVGERKSPALSRGTLWHLVMETHYKYLQECQKAGTPPDPEQLVKLQGNILYDSGMNQSEDQELVGWMYTEYIKMWGIDPEFHILGVEHATTVPLLTANGHRSRFSLKLKIDLVVRWNGRIWIIDHKSCKDLPKDKNLDIDDQFGLYTWALRRQGHRVWGSLHNAARTFRPKVDTTRERNADGLYLNKNGSISKNQGSAGPLEERFSRTPLVRTEPELEMIALEAYRTARNAYQWADGEAPRAPDPDRCGWRCDYTEPCLAARKGRDQSEVLVEFGFHQDFTRH